MNDEARASEARFVEYIESLVQVLGYVDRAGLSALVIKGVARPNISLVGGEFIEARGLALVLWQAAPPILVKNPEIGLAACVSLVGGELVEARGLAVVLWQAAAPILV